jgi:ferritin-like protein
LKDYHETVEDLSDQTREIVRTLTSLKEEIEAIDWYQQRYDATRDKLLKKIFLHNRNEEIEHACMTLEWLRRYMDGWNKQLKSYLFSEGEITELEEEEA